MLVMRDKDGKDEKILAVPVDKLRPFFKDVSSYQQLPAILLDQIVHFFTHYKDLEPGKWVKLVNWCDAVEAANYLTATIEKASSKKSQ